MQCRRYVARAEPYRSQIRQALRGGRTEELERLAIVLYLFVDGIAERLHLGQPREAVLAAWGITQSGSKVLLGLAPGTKEDTVSCRDFLRDLKARGLCDPVLVATDGAPGLIRAVEEVLPRSLRQRCLAHYADLRIMPTPCAGTLPEAGNGLVRSA